MIHTAINVVAATTANITRQDEQTIDGVNAVANDLVCVKNQTDPKENGLYYVRAGAVDWKRYMLSGYDVMYAVGGTVNAGKSYIVTNGPGMQYGTSDIVILEAYNLLEPEASQLPFMLIDVGTTASVVVALRKHNVLIEHTALKTDGTASASTDTLYVMHASSTMAATVTWGRKLRLTPTKSYGLRGVDFANAYGYDHVMQLRAAGNGCKAQLLVGSLGT